MLVFRRHRRTVGQVSDKSNEIDFGSCSMERSMMVGSEVLGPCCARFKIRFPVGVSRWLTSAESFRRMLSTLTPAFMTTREVTLFKANSASESASGNLSATDRNRSIADWRSRFPPFLALDRISCSHCSKRDRLFSSRARRVSHTGTIGSMMCVTIWKASAPVPSRGLSL